MRELDIHVDKKSKWLTATPTEYIKKLPFYIMEAGCFYADKEYVIEREYHDSFLLLYSLNGEGMIQTDQSSLSLPAKHLFLLDCHTPHSYHTTGEHWDFIWLHINGTATKLFYDTLYPNELNAIAIENIENKLLTLLAQTEQTSLHAAFTTSEILHELLNSCIFSVLQKEQIVQKRSYEEDIEHALSFIEAHFSSQITVDDIISDIPVSKYHFIRLFKRTMGVTPYHYVNIYRINYAKKLLRTTSLPVSEISENCGFLDTSNFIYQFQKITGLRPTAYRKTFMIETI